MLKVSLFCYWLDYVTCGHKQANLYQDYMIHKEANQIIFQILP